MANVVNKANPTVFYLSVNTPEYPSSEWLHSPPSLHAVLGSVPSKYWKIVSNDLMEMTSGEKATVDAALATAEAAAAKQGAKDHYDGAEAEMRSLRALVKLTVDELNAIRQWIESFRNETTSPNSLSNFRTRVGSLPSMPDRTYSQARTAFRNQVDSE